MSDIFTYRAALKGQHNRAEEVAQRLLLVLRQRLDDVVARDLRVNGSQITFHGGASATAVKPHRLVSNWNLLASISRGAIQVQSNSTNFDVSFWLGFPKSVFSMPLLLITILFFVIGVIVQMQSNFPFMPIVLLPVFIFLFAIALTWLITILRFRRFVRSCINQAKHEIEKPASRL